MEVHKQKVILIQRIFSNYRKAIFDKLNDQYDFLLLHSKNKSGISQTSTCYSKIVKSVKYSKKDTSVFLFVFIELIKFKPDVIIHEFNPSIISLHISFLYAILFNKIFIVWGHGYNRQNGFNPNSSFKSKVRLWYMKHADALLVYGQEGKKELSKYISVEKIFVAQNTLDTVSLIKIRKQFEKIGVTTIKKELGITHKYNLVFIGRLLIDKKPDLLIDIFNQFDPALQKDIGIHIIGDGEMYDDLKRKIEGCELEKSIFLHGKITDNTVSGKYLFISDLLVNPGYLGLSVNHAFCFLKPVVSFKEEKGGYIHSPEVEYVKQNMTGYFADSYSIRDMCNFIELYINNNLLKQRMCKEIDDLIENRASMNNMVKGIIDSVKYTNKK